MRKTEAAPSKRGRVLPSPVRLGGTLAATLAIVLAGAGAAGAATARPQLVRPKHGGVVHVHRIELVVKDASPLAKRYGVFVGISRSKVRKHGFLAKTGNVKKGESFVKLKRWKGHRGMWIYRPPSYSFPGFWASTSGRYYWQAEHTDCNLKGCEDVSKVGSFRVAG